MNWWIPKIKLIFFFLLSPVCSFLSDDAQVLYFVEIHQPWGFASSVPLSENSESSETDFSVYQLQLHAVQQAGSHETSMAIASDIAPTAVFAAKGQWRVLSRLAFLTAHHYQASFVEGCHPFFTLARHLLWEVFLR